MTNILKEIVKEEGVYDIINSYKYQFEFCEKYNRVIAELKTIRRKHIKTKLLRNTLTYHYNYLKSPNDILMIHNLKKNSIWRLYNYGSSFDGKPIIIYKFFGEILPIYTNFR